MIATAIWSTGVVAVVGSEADSASLLAVNKISVKHSKITADDGYDNCQPCKDLGHSCFSATQHPSSCFSPAWKKDILTGIEMTGNERCEKQFNGTVCSGKHSKKKCKKRGHSCYVKGLADPCFSPPGGKAACEAKEGWSSKKKTPKGVWLGYPFRDAWTEEGASPTISLDDGEDDRRDCTTCKKMGHSCLVETQESPCFSPGWQESESGGISGSERCESMGGTVCKDAKHTKKTCTKRGHNCFVEGWSDPCAASESEAECKKLVGWAPPPKGEWLGAIANLDSWTKDAPGCCSWTDGLCANTTDECNSGEDMCANPTTEGGCGGTWCTDCKPYEAPTGNLADIHSDCRNFEGCLPDEKTKEPLTCFEKNEYWAGCLKTCEPGKPHPDDPDKEKKPWSCKKPHCKPQMCRMYCEHGFEQDKKGCDMCRCKKPVCPQVMCMMHCEHGFIEENGCPVCRCSTGGSGRSGLIQGSATRQRPAPGPGSGSGGPDNR